MARRNAGARHNAGARCNTGLAANGFGPRSLLKEEAEALFGAWYPCPPDMRAGSRWSLGVSSVPVPDAPRRRERDCHQQVMAHYWHGLTAVQRQDPQWNPANTEFRRIHADRINRWDGPGAPPRDKNVDGRNAFWSVPGRTLRAILDHIASGGERLETPPAAYAAPPPANQWAPRRTASLTSSSSSARSSAPSSSRRAPPSPLLVPKLEPGTSTRRRLGTLVIAGSSAGGGAAKKVKEEAPSSLLAEMIATQQQLATDDPEGVAAAWEASVNTIQPLPSPKAREWSFQDHLAITGTPLLYVDSDSDGGDGGFGGGANNHEASSSRAGAVKDEALDWSAFDDYRR